MWLNQTTPPAETPISLSEAKQHLRVLHDDDDEYIGLLIDAATKHIEGREGILGRALVSQSWEHRIDRFPECDRFELPFPPLQSVSSITYVDTDGNIQTLSGDVYSVETATLTGMVCLKFEQSWPGVRQEPFAVRIAFVAGYGAAAAVPETLKSGMKLLIGHWYVNRDGDVDMVRGAPFAIDALIGQHRTGQI